MVIHVHGKDELVVQFRVSAPFEHQARSNLAFFNHWAMMNFAEHDFLSKIG